MEWVVSLDASMPGTFSDELADRIIENLEEYSPAVGGRGQRIGVTMSVEASTDRQAFDRAHVALRQALGHRARVIDARVQSVEELERELEAPAVPALAGIREVAQVLGVSRQRASELAGSAGFPKPIANLAAGPVWFHSTIRSFNERWVRRSGRPRASKEKSEDVANGTHKSDKGPLMVYPRFFSVPLLPHAFVIMEDYSRKWTAKPALGPSKQRLALIEPCGHDQTDLKSLGPRTFMKKPLGLVSVELKGYALPEQGMDGRTARKDPATRSAFRALDALYTGLARHYLVFNHPVGKTAAIAVDRRSTEAGTAALRDALTRLEVVCSLWDAPPPPGSRVQDVQPHGPKDDDNGRSVSVRTIQGGGFETNPRGH